VLDPKYVDTIILRWQEFQRRRGDPGRRRAQLRRDSPPGVRPVQGYPTIWQAVERRLSRGTALAGGTTEVISGGGVSGFLNRLTLPNLEQEPAADQHGSTQVRKPTSQKIHCSRGTVSLTWWMPSR
jgi:hypothetical protein